jgi:putative membrane protein
MLMSSLTPKTEASDKTLILVVDIDDDLGSVGIKTPIIGYDDVLRASIEFAKRKPADSDLNAMFAALAAYERLKDLSGNVEIAVIAGVRDDWAKAMYRVNSILSKLKAELGFTNIYFVSDGVSDEQLIPVVSNYGRIIGVERVIVEQSRGIEETYVLLLRYLKKAFTEEPYAKFFLGVPGILLLFISILALVGLSRYIWDLTLLFLGAVFVVKGFGITGAFREKWRMSPVIATLYAFSALILALAFTITLIIIYFSGFTVKALLDIIESTTYLYLIGIILLYGGRIFDKLLQDKPHLLWRDSIVMVPMIFLLLIAQNVSLRLGGSKGSSINAVMNVLLSPESILLIIVAIIVTFILSLLFFIIEKKMVV